jgi:hypothetical protein
MDSFETDRSPEQQACTHMGEVWATAAQRRYSFDSPTARRLAFVRWLYATGRWAARALCVETTAQ